MRRRSTLMLIALVAAILVVALAMRGRGAGLVTRWLPALHGQGGHR